MTQETLLAFRRLADTLDTVRQQCPWDKVQTTQSLRYLTIEETYELNEAIIALSDGNDANQDMKKELGDLFMHLLFYCKIAEEEHRFTTADVLNGIADKLVARHPFIFNPEADKGEGWEQIKMHEGRHSVLDGVPASLPTLVKSVRLQEKAAGIGYPQDEASTDSSNILESVSSEEAFGNLLFSLIRLAHNHGINADDALSKANHRFEQQVRKFEES